jgi:hypothetical protein
MTGRNQREGRGRTWPVRIERVAFSRGCIGGTAGKGKRWQRGHGTNKSTRTRRKEPAGTGAGANTGSNQANDRANHLRGEGRRILRDAGSRSFVNRGRTNPSRVFTGIAGGKGKGLHQRETHPIGKAEVRGGLDQIMVMMAVFVVLPVRVPVRVMTMTGRRMVYRTLFAMDPVTMFMRG